MKYRNNPMIKRAPLVMATLAFAVGTTAHATSYFWGGGTLDWSDTSASGWNGGPPTFGDTATINNGTVTLTTNNLVNPLASLILGGTGKLTQTTDNTWSAFNNFTLSGGTLESVRSSGDVFGSYQLSNTVNVSGSSASTISTSGSGSIFINLGLAVNDSPTFTTFNVGNVTSDTATDLSVSTVLANNIATNFVSFSAAGLIKTGVGTMTLSANNIFTGGTTVNDGVLEITGSSGGNSYIRGTVTVNSGAELRYTSGDGTGFGFIGGNKLDTININGGLVNSQGSMTHLWGATVNMTGGELRSNDGTSSPTGLRIEWNNSTVNTAASTSAATISGRINLRDDGGYSSAVFNVANGSAATDLVVSAAVTQSGGSVGITKNGAGTMEFTGSNSYLGATQVSEGKLLINGDNSAATGAVTVAAGATLGGTGTVGGATTINGTHTPGNSPGVQAFSNALNYASTSVFEWDLASSGSGTRGTQYDGVNVGGTLSGDSGSTFKVVLGSGAFSDSFWNSNQSWADIFKSNVDGSGTALNIASVFSAIQWFEGTNDMTSSTGMEGYFSISGSSLNWTAVPEPTGALAGVLLSLGLLRRRRIS